MRKPAVFLDRDGTLIKEKEYLHDPDLVELEFGAIEMLRVIRDLGFSIVVLTNQSGIGRGFFGADAVAAVHQRIEDLLAASGVSIDAWYVCPHAPHDTCRCRKPSMGMLEDALSELDLEPCSSFIVGDKMTDVIMARTLGAIGILVMTGHGSKQADLARQEGFKVCSNLFDVTHFILDCVKGAKSQVSISRPTFSRNNPK